MFSLNNLYREALELIPIDFVIMDNQARYQFVSRQSVRDPQVRQWLLGKTDFDYCRERNRPLAIAEKRHRAFLEALETRKMLSFEEAIEVAGGTEYKIRTFNPVLNDAGEVIYLFGYGFDVTRMKQAQLQIQQLMLAIEAAYDGIGVLDAEGRYTYMNQQHATIFGYEDPSELLGKTWHALYEADEIRRIEQEVFPLLQKEGRYLGQTNGRAKDGKKVLQQITLTALPEGGLICICRDISGLQQIEQELRIALEASEASAKAKRRFLANMSHEIRTPMNAIVGFTDRLLKTGLSEEQENYTQIIQTATGNLLTVIDDILDLSRIEEGKLPIERIRMHLGNVAEKVTEILLFKAREKNISLQLSIHPRLHHDVLGDPYRLNQILLNVLGNAIKFTHEGFVRMQIMPGGEAEGRQWVEFIIEDTGIGMDEKMVRNAFCEFQQEDESFIRKYGGTGLGLSITRSLVELMGGTIELTSKKGQGTRVVFRLPYEAAPATMRLDTALLTPELAGKADHKILIVEDNKFNAMLTTMMLKEKGIAYELAVNGLEAVEKARQMSFSLILMDIQMPQMDGVSATRIIREELKLSLPIIALTAHALSEEKDIYLNAGMNDFLTKPFKEQELLQVLHRWLNEPPHAYLPG